MLEPLLEIAVAVLLLATIGWCVAVHRRLRRLAAERGTIEAAVTRLEAATGRAEEATRALKRALAEAADDLERHLAAARRQAAELRRLTEAARVAGPRPLTRPAAARGHPAPTAEAASPGAGQQAVASAAREDVLEALRALR
jgi:hypothetical protein